MDRVCWTSGMDKMVGGAHMPLRDHFHPPLSEIRGWDALHGAWPTLIVLDFNHRLPRRFVASPRIRLGPEFEIDVAASDSESISTGVNSVRGGAAATALWAPPRHVLLKQRYLTRMN